MQLDFTPEQEALRATVREVLAKECPMTLVRGVVEGTHDVRDLWSTMAQLDWPALTVAADHGGIGLGSVELAVVAEELGRVAAPGPLLTTMSQLVPMLAVGDPERAAPFLADVAAGSVAGTLAVATPDGDFRPASTAVTATPLAEGTWRLSGRAGWVLELPSCTEVAVVARAAGSTGDDGVGVWLVPVTDVDHLPVTSFDLTRQVNHLILDDVSVAAERCIVDPGLATAAVVETALESATVALALEMVGTAQAIFDMTLAYAREREQFGVPIGSFQAIKHKFADLLVSIERARATAYFASVALAEGDPRRAMATAMAKATAGDMQRLVAKEGIQIHGGIGYMWEHDVQLLVKHLKSGELLFGGASTHRQMVAHLLGV